MLSDTLLVLEFDNDHFLSHVDISSCRGSQLYTCRDIHNHVSLPEDLKDKNLIRNDKEL